VIKSLQTFKETPGFNWFFRWYI